MTVLRHRVLSGTTPQAGVTVTARAYSGNKYAPNSGTALSAVTDAQGWAQFDIPDSSARRTFWALRRPGADPVIVTVPRASGTVTSTDSGVSQGTLDAQSELVSTRPTIDPTPDTDTERETFIPARLSDAALRAALVPGSVYNANGTLNATKRLHIKLTADGTDIDDLFIETVTP